MRVIDVKDNFLSKASFKKISKIVMSDTFPWYFAKQATIEKTTHGKDSFFCHSLSYKQDINSTFFNDIIEPFRKKLKFTKVLRAKMNLNYNQGKPIKSNYHSDFVEFEKLNKKYTTVIFYFNTCNGYTEFKDHNIKINSEENRVVMFPGELQHRTVTQTNENRRVLLNLNFV